MEENNKQERALYPNTTQVSNYILDNMYLFSDGELRVLLIITRKTIGWHKETDYLSYKQLRELTGKSKQTVSDAVNYLIEKKLICRLDSNGNDLTEMPNGFRGQIFYTLNKDCFISNIEELVKNLDRSKSDIGTGLKFRPYKTHSLQNSKELAKPISNKNVENVDNSQPSPTKPKGFNSLKQVMEKIKSKSVKSTDRVVSTPHQAWGFEVMEALKLPEEYAPRLIKAVKNKPYSRIRDSYAKTLNKCLVAPEERLRYFFKTLDVSQVG